MFWLLAGLMNIKFEKKKKFPKKLREFFKIIFVRV